MEALCRHKSLLVSWSFLNSELPKSSENLPDSECLPDSSEVPHDPVWLRKARTDSLFVENKKSTRKHTGGAVAPTDTILKITVLQVQVAKVQSNLDLRDFVC